MKRHCVLLVSLVLCSYSSLSSAVAQNFAEGISGDIDAKRRGPVVSVSVEQSAGSKVSKLLADAYMPNSEFAKYPIRFDFYVNRQLLASQIRASELPGPVGVDVTEQVAPLPFNYAVVATLLHPNRHFTSIYYGAAFKQELSAKLDCSLVLTTPGSGDEQDTEDIYEASEVPLVQTGNETVTASFDAQSETSGESVSVSATLTVNSANKTEISSGSLTVTQDGTATTYSVSGDIAYEGETPNDLSVETSDLNVSLSCQ